MLYTRIGSEPSRSRFMYCCSRLAVSVLLALMLILAYSLMPLISFAGCKDYKEQETGSSICGAFYHILASQQHTVPDPEVRGCTNLSDPGKPENCDHRPPLLALSPAKAYPAAMDSSDAPHGRSGHKSGAFTLNLASAYGKLYTAGYI